VIENGELRSICEPERDEEMGRWRKLHNVELHDLYSWPSIIKIIKLRRIRGMGACSMNGEEEHAEVIGRKVIGKETTRRPSCRYVDNFKMDLVEMGSGGVDCSFLAQDGDK
jgi:hypothetical protein